MAAILAILLQDCFGVIAAALLLRLSAKQDPDMYLAGRLLPLFLAPLSKAQ